MHCLKECGKNPLNFLYLDFIQIPQYHYYFRFCRSLRLRRRLDIL